MKQLILNKPLPDPNIIYFDDLREPTSVIVKNIYGIAGVVVIKDARDCFVKWADGRESDHKPSLFKLIHHFNSNDVNATFFVLD